MMSVIKNKREAQLTDGAVFLTLAALKHQLGEEGAEVGRVEVYL